MTARLGDPVSSITARVAESLPSWLGPSSRLVQSSPELKRFKYSFYLRYPVSRGDDSATTVLVKIQRLPEHDTLNVATAHVPDLRQKARLEFDLLMDFWHSFGSHENEYASAIRPLGFLEEWAAIVTEELPGVSLRRLLERPRWFSVRGAWHAEGEVVFRNVGLWLRRFHHRTAESTRIQLPVDDLAAEMKGRLLAIGEGGVRRIDLSAESELTSRLLESLRGGSCVVAVLHHDFHPDNVLVTNDSRVAVLDPWPKQPAPVYHDLAMALTYVPLCKVHQLTRGLLVDRRRSRELERHLLEAYFGSPDPERPGVGLFCAMEVATRWSQNETAVASRQHSKRTLMRIKRGYFRGLLRYWLRYGLESQ